MENAKKMLKGQKANEKPQMNTDALKLDPRKVISNTVAPNMGSNITLKVKK